MLLKLDKRKLKLFHKIVKNVSIEKCLQQIINLCPNVVITEDFMDNLDFMLEDCGAFKNKW